MVAGTCAAIVAGTLVTGSGPHAGDENAPRLDFDVETVARIHGVLVMATVAVVIVLASRISKRPAERAALTEAVSIWLFVGLLQAAIGYIQYFNDLPVLLVGTHVGGAAAVTLATTHLVLRARPCYGNGSALRTLEVGAVAT
jgi:cytochrome c oxidase assembly protein subunit 15